MEITIGKILSLVIALAYVLLAIFAAGWEGLSICLPLLLPLSLIWFPDEMGSFTGYVGRGGNINQESSPVVVSAIGWFFLVGMPAVVMYLAG